MVTMSLVIFVKFTELKISNKNDKQFFFYFEEKCYDENYRRSMLSYCFLVTYSV